MEPSYSLRPSPTRQSTSPTSLVLTPRLPVRQSCRALPVPPMRVCGPHLGPLPPFPASPGLGAWAEVAGHDAVSLSSPADPGHRAHVSTTLEGHVPRWARPWRAEAVLLTKSPSLMHPPPQLDSVHLLRGFQLPPLFEEGGQSSDDSFRWSTSPH